MESMDITETGTRSVARILCFQCGTPIETNATNMCVACLRSHVDITEDIPKQATVSCCKSCGRYSVPPSQWQVCAPESKELLSVCLKKLKGLSQVRLVDAAFVWTEPHSRRLKVKLTVQKEVMQGAVLQQTFIVEYVVHTQMCDNCHRAEAKDFWRCSVQVRQKAHHKKTFYYLEQLILKHKAHARTVNIKQVPDGVDFFFANKSDGRKFLDFLMTVVPCRYKTSEQLLSHDPNNNIYNYKYSFSVEIVPICKDDVVCLPRETAQQLGNFSELCICTRVTSVIQLIDPRTAQVAEMNANTYFRDPFRSICTQKHFSEFTVVNVEHLRDSEIHTGGQKPSDKSAQETKLQLAHIGTFPTSTYRTIFSARSEVLPPLPADLKPALRSLLFGIKHQVSDIWAMRSADLGKADAHQYCARSHLGHLLNPGDTVLGFDLLNSNINEEHFEQLEKRRKDRIPDVIFVKKVFADRNTRKRHRQWKLRRLRKENGSVSGGSAEGDYQDFLEDLEEDPNVRQGVNIYRDPTAMPVDSDDQDEEYPKISLQEMLDGLNLNEDEEVLPDAGNNEPDNDSQAEM